MEQMNTGICEEWEVMVEGMGWRGGGWGRRAGALAQQHERNQVRERELYSLHLAQADNVGVTSLRNRWEQLMGAADISVDTGGGKIMTEQTVI